MDMIAETHVVDGSVISNPNLYHSNHPLISEYMKNLEKIYANVTSDAFIMPDLEGYYDFLKLFRICGSKILLSTDYLNYISTHKVPHYAVYSTYTTINSYGVKSWHFKISVLDVFVTLGGKVSSKYRVTQHYSLRMSKAGHPIMVTFKQGQVRAADPLPILHDHYKVFANDINLDPSDKIRKAWVTDFLKHNPRTFNFSPLYEFSQPYCLQLTPHFLDPSLTTPLDFLKASLPKRFQRKDIYRELLSAMRYERTPMSIYVAVYPLLLTLDRHKVDPNYVVGAIANLASSMRRTHGALSLSGLINVPEAFWVKLVKRLSRTRESNLILGDTLSLVCNNTFDDIAYADLSSASNINDLHDLVMRLDTRIKTQKENERTNTRLAKQDAYRATLERQCARIQDFGFHPMFLDQLEDLLQNHMISLSFDNVIRYKEGVYERSQTVLPVLTAALKEANVPYYEVRLPQTPDQLKLWGDEQGHCVGQAQYQRAVAYGQYLIAGAFHEDTLVSVLQLRHRDPKNIEDCDFNPQDWIFDQLASKRNFHRPWHDAFAQALAGIGVEVSDNTFLGIRSSEH